MDQCIDLYSFIFPRVTQIKSLRPLTDERKNIMSREWLKITESYCVTVHTARLGVLRHLLTVGQRTRDLEMKISRTRSAVTNGHHKSTNSGV